MFCSICGTLLDLRNIKNEGDIPYCSKCDKLFFPKVNLAMIAILTNDENQICLINQKGSNQFKVLIAGFIKPSETLEECVKREIYEEVGLVVEATHYLNSHFYEGNDVLMVGFEATTIENEFMIDQDELDNANWYDYNDCLHRIREGSIAYKLVEQFLNINQK